MDSKQFVEAGHTAISDIASFLADEMPNLRVTPALPPGSLGPMISDTAPEQPEAFSTIKSSIRELIIPFLTHWQHPNWLAFFPAHTTFPSILAELYSAAFNAPAFNWICSPAATELETKMMDWMCRFLNLPDAFLSTGAGGGVIQGSASEATCSVMIAARERAVQQILDAEGWGDEKGLDADALLKREDRMAEIRGRLVALGSEQSHSSVHKAANICGVRYRTVPAPRSQGFRMTGEAVRRKLVEVVGNGLIPFFVGASLGTTGTCAVDEFDKIVEACEEVAGRSKVWVHVDAAYAGAALCCEEFRQEIKGLEVVDSFDMNMHKWMLVNFDASCLFLRDRAPLISAMSISPSYLLNPDTLKGRVTDYRDWQIPLGRRFRALKIWFVLRAYGGEKIRAMIRKHVELGEYFAGLVRKRADLFEIVTGPAYALTVIRCVLPSQTKTPVSNGEIAEPRPNAEDEMNDFGNKANDVDLTNRENNITRQVCELINSRGEFFITGQVLADLYVIRIVGANENTSQKSLKAAFDALVATVEEIKAAAGS